MSAINDLKKFIKEHSVENIEEDFNEDDLPNEYEDEVCESKCAIDTKKYKKFLRSKNLKENKQLKEDVESEDTIRHYVEPYFSHSSDAFIDVVVDLVGRIEDWDNLDEEIYSAIDAGLIYDADQWEIMKNYQRPSEADFNSAVELLTEDLYSICNQILEEKEESLEESKEPLKEGALEKLKAFVKEHSIKEDINEDDLPNDFEEQELTEDASKKVAELKRQLKSFSRR